MKKSILLLVIFLLITGCASRKSHLGMFSNEAEGFHRSKLMVHENGVAIFSISLFPVIGEWSYSQRTSVLTLKVLDVDSLEYRAIDLDFDRHRRQFRVLHPEQEGTEQAIVMRFVSDTFPENYDKGLESYHESLRKLKADAEDQAQAKKEYEERLELERPEYEKALVQIRENPDVVLTEQFDPAFSGRTPSIRALQERVFKTLCHAYQPHRLMWPSRRPGKWIAI